MASVNKVFLVGNLGSDPEIRYTGGGQAVANFRIATTESWKDKAGAKQEKTEWHSIVVWGKPAENCAEYLKKGRPVHIEGRLQTRKWQDKSGADRYTTEIVADRVTFLGGGDRSGGEYRREEPKNEEPRGSSGEHSPPIDDDQIPF